MPSPRVLDLTERKPDPTGVEEFFSKLSKHYGDQQDQNILDPILEQVGKDQNFQNASIALERSRASPSKKVEMRKQLNEMQKLQIEREKASNAQLNKSMLSQQERATQKDNLIKAGYPDYEAEIYLDAPPGVKQRIKAEHAELVARELRKPLVQSTDELGKNFVSTDQEIKPIFIDDLESDVDKNNVKASLVPEDSWSAPIVPQNLTPADKVKWENNNEKENNKELKSTETKKKAYANNDILINSMTKINDSGKLPSGLGKVAIDPKTGDLRSSAQLVGLINPETELYVKNLKQFLKGAKEFFGARVTNFDVTSFMAQLPTLLNSEQGRRIILKQMKYVNDLEMIHNNILNQAFKKYGRTANYNQILQESDKKIIESEKDLVWKINNLVEASEDLNTIAKNPEFRGTILMQNPKGEFRAVPKHKVEELKTKKWRDF